MTRVLSAASFVFALCCWALGGSAGQKAPVSIETYGAIAGSASYSQVNTDALEEALTDANGGGTVLVPVSADGPFYITATSVADLTDVTLQIDGTLTAQNDIATWPNSSVTTAMNVLQFSNVSGLTITGSGTVDGQGYVWWWAALSHALPDVNSGRPHLICLESCSDVVLEGVTLYNSPQFHFKVDGAVNVVIRNTSVMVDVEGQRELLKSHGQWHPESNFPLFPLNTDGYDLKGQNMLVHDVTITNFDDGVVPKPQLTAMLDGSDRRSGSGSCTENIMVRNIVTFFTVGMSIGSVPPAVGNNCIRNVTFDNVTMNYPFKAIYLKTDPGVDGTGLIEDIRFQNFAINDPIWFTIYLGPQQMDSDYGGPGCFLYPLDWNCPTQPLVTIRDVSIVNVTVTGALLNPGIIRCNSTNPCTGITLQNVNFENSPWADVNYICENAEVDAIDSYPAPACQVIN